MAFIVTLKHFDIAAAAAVFTLRHLSQCLESFIFRRTLVLRLFRP